MRNERGISMSINHGQRQPIIAAESVASCQIVLPSGWLYSKLTKNSHA
jgi:hypothetical protein